MFKLFRKPKQGEMTVIAGDPAEGGDYCAAVAKSKKHNDSFLVFNEKMDSAQFGYELYKMAKLVQHYTGEWPVLAVERNVGMATISTLDQLNYPKMFRMPILGKAFNPAIDTGDVREEAKIGWITTADVRRKMLDELSHSLNQRRNTIHDVVTVRQLMSFVNKNGKFEAATGANDDLVIAEAIAWQMILLTPHTPDRASRQAKIAQFPKQKLFDDQGISNV